jgi:hypothetical protein
MQVAVLQRSRQKPRTLGVVQSQVSQSSRRLQRNLAQVHRMSSFKSASRCLNKVSGKRAARGLNSQLIAAPHSGAYSATTNRDATANPQNANISALPNVQSKLPKARPNRSLNRTLHSVPAFALAKNASTNSVPLFRAG